MKKIIRYLCVKCRTWSKHYYCPKCGTGGIIPTKSPEEK